MKSLALLFLTLLLPPPALAQVNSGSNGSDGAFNPTSDIVIDMADHPDGIYHYTSVNIPAGVTVSFIPNAGNKPVVWLVQGDCVIAGSVLIDGGAPVTGELDGKTGGAGGFRGGHSAGTQPTPGQAGLGPGGGVAGNWNPGPLWGGNGSFGEIGERGEDPPANFIQQPPGSAYGNAFLLPMVGGSGGGAGEPMRTVRVSAAAAAVERSLSLLRV